MEKKKTNRYSLNFGKAHEKIIEWCEYQTNFSDAIKYLIEEEMKRNGIRNLQEFIPSIRHVPSNILKVTNSDIELDQESTILNIENPEVIFKGKENDKEILKAEAEVKPTQEPKKPKQPKKTSVACFED